MRIERIAQHAFHHIEQYASRRAVRHVCVCPSPCSTSDAITEMTSYATRRHMDKTPNALALRRGEDREAIARTR